MTGSGAIDQGAAPRDHPFAAALRGFGPAGLAAFIVILMGNALLPGLSGILVLVWASVSRTPWPDLGFARPRSWLLTIVFGIICGIAFKFIMKAVVMPLLGADPVNHAYHYLAGNTAALPGALLLVIVGAGFGEETVFRGYFFERLGKLLGSGALAKTAIVLLTSTVFALAHHHDQGLAGTEQAAFTGLVFGTIFAITGSIWLPMVAHAAFDVAAVAIIYRDAESAIAHFVFR
jgi:CAAX protease family protein